MVYTDPELAMVGRTEAELKDAGIPFNAGRFMFRANGRAKGLGNEVGMVKILAHKKTDELLGVHMVGPRTSELIAEATVAMEMRASRSSERPRWRSTTGPSTASLAIRRTNCGGSRFARASPDQTTAVPD